MREVGTGRPFPSVIVKLVLLVTVIKGGCQLVPLCGRNAPLASVFKDVQVAFTGAVAVLQNRPHMGTTCPSGRVTVVRCAVRLTDWAEHRFAKRRRLAIASATVFTPVLR
jgi:hypothetical protein